MKLVHPPLPDDLVTFNVRGRTFQTTLTTLRRFPESVLYKMIEWEQNIHKVTSDESSCQDAFFIDRDPDLFAAILRYHDTDEYLGDSLHDVPSESLQAVTPRSLLLEAQYYNIKTLEQKIIEKQPSSTSVMYTLCIIKPHRYPDIDKSWGSWSVDLSYLPLSEEGAKSYSADRALNGLDLGNGYLHGTIKQMVDRRNAANQPEGYKWTISAVTANCERIDRAEGVGVILKGEKQSSV